jgi:hypothetical protein
MVGSESEQAFFRELTVGGSGLLQSAKNVEAALAGLGVDQTWEDLFSDYVGVPAVDDQTPASVDIHASLQVPSWNFPQAYRNAADNGFDLDFPNGFPLRPKLILLRTIPFTGFSDQFSLLPSTAVYLRLEGVFETPLTRIAITDPNGSSFTSGSDVQITIIRVL